MIHVQFGPQRLPRAQYWPNFGTCASQHFLCFDNGPKIKSRKNTLCAPPSAQPPAAALCAAARHPAPLRGASRRPSGALRAPRAARAALLQTRKKCPFIRPSSILTVGEKTHEYCELFMIIRSLSIQSHDSSGADGFKLMIISVCCIQTQLIVFMPNASLD